MIVCVAGITHVHNLDVEHAVTDLLQCRPFLGLELKEHLFALIVVIVAINSHSLLNLFALLSAQVLVLDIITFCFVPLGLEVV